MLPTLVERPSTAIAVLLVEDDLRLGQFTASYLTDRGLSVRHVTSGAAALASVAALPYDVVVLDVMLPGKDGFAVCKAIRERSDVPILMLTARGEETDKVLGLELGADDYVVKPFSPRELLARIQAFVRRHRGDLTPRPRELRAGPLTLSAATMTASLDGHPLHLTHTEYQLLQKLMERPGRVMSRDQLLELVKGGTDEAFDRAIDVQVSRLRHKLAEAAEAAEATEADRGRSLIRTIRGVGYMLVVEA
jgi:two-component system OmpR family response regulator